jgi:hypothetical protein
MRHRGLMAPSESARHELYNALIPVIGPEPTETLMTHLLPSPSEFDLLRSEMNDRFDRMDERFDRLNDRFNERFDRLLIAQIGGFTALIVAIFLN